MLPVLADRRVGRQRLQPRGPLRLDLLKVPLQVPAGHEVGLADGVAKAVPHLAPGVDAAGGGDYHRKGEVDVVGVDETHAHARVAREGAVHGVVGQDLAVDAVTAAREHREGGWVWWARMF